MLNKKFFKLRSKNLLLVFIFTIALILRLVDLNNTPSGLHADEASFLLNAKAILNTGMDEDGRFLPLTLHSLIDPKPALYSYLQIPFVALFGTSVLAARLPAVLFGLASILMVYLLLKKLGQEKIGMVVAILLAISPWHIVVSRATQEVILSFFFFILALYFFFDFIGSQKKQHLLLLFMSCLLSMYFYHSAKILLVVLLIFYLCLYKAQKKLTQKNCFLALAAIVLATVLSFMLQESTTRFNSIGILASKEPQIKIFEQIFAATGRVPQFLLRAFYNKPAAYFYQFIEEYLQYFNFDFLFLSWGEPKRYLIPHHGLFYLIELPFLLIGIYSALRKKNKTLFFIFLALAILAPLPAALTAQETPSMIRTFSMILALSYFIAEGLVYVFSWKKTKSIIFLSFFSLAYLWQIAYFQMQFFVQQKVYQPWSRNHPFSEIASRVKDLEKDYDLIYTTNDLRPLYAYFALENLISIDQLQANALARDEEDYQIGKYRFNRQACYFPELKENVLYIAEVGCKDKVNKWADLQVVETISYPDGLAVYDLLTLTTHDEQ
jgi:uncharacterized membrane protein